MSVGCLYAVRRASGAWDVPSERPLEDKLAKYLDLVFGRAQAKGFLRNGLVLMQESVAAFEPPPRDTYCTLMNAEQLEASRKALEAKATRRKLREESRNLESDTDNLELDVPLDEEDVVDVTTVYTAPAQ